MGRQLAPSFMGLHPHGFAKRINICLDGGMKRFRRLRYVLFFLAVFDKPLRFRIKPVRETGAVTIFGINEDCSLQFRTEQVSTQKASSRQVCIAQVRSGEYRVIQVGLDQYGSFES